MRILVAGAGIGGLATANALSRTGHDVVVAEAADRIEAVGAGITLAPNATLLLERLGVDLSGVGFPLTSLELLSSDGRPLAHMAPQETDLGYGPIWAVARPDLHRVLADALPEGVDLRLGQRVEGLTDHADRVDVVIAGAAESFDVLVGADGINSAVRLAVHGEVPLRYSGTTCWRGICRNPGFEGAVETWGGDTRVGVVPLAGERIYYFLVADAPPRAPELEWPDALRARFAVHTSGPVAALFDAMDEAPPLHHDLTELDAPVWGERRVVLLGDAAHAMTPNQGQGAAMAIEDAYALAQVLGSNVVESRRRYVEIRHRRVRTVQLMSRRIGAVAHWRNPVARSVRDAMLRATPSRAAATQLRRLIEPGIALAKTPLRIE